MTNSWCPTPPAAPPTQDRRQLVGSNQVANSICHLGMNRLLLTGLLRQLLTRHFSLQENIVDPDLRALVWREVASSGIMIESVTRQRLDMTEKRPAVLIKGNAYTNLRITMADRGVVDGQGNQHYQTLWLGSHTLFCVHGTGASCEALAIEVQRELTQFGPEIVNTYDLQKFQVTEVGPVSAVEESTQNFVVPVVVGWCYEESWKLAADALPLKGVSISFNLHDL